MADGAVGGGGGGVVVRAASPEAAAARVFLAAPRDEMAALYPEEGVAGEPPVDGPFAMTVDGGGSGAALGCGMVVRLAGWGHGRRSPLAGGAAATPCSAARASLM